MSFIKGNLLNIEKFAWILINLQFLKPSLDRGDTTGKRVRWIKCLIGHIKEIIRHPVKSFYGESVKETKIMKYGLYGDRSHAFLDETRKGKFLTITQFPEMVRYKARFAGEESIDRYPKVEIVTPEGPIFHWGDKELTKEIESKSKRKISLVSYTPSAVPLGAIEEEHIQLITDASLDQLKENGVTQNLIIDVFVLIYIYPYKKRYRLLKRHGLANG
ncbi:MOSC N-terminal beta barrel domain-containing protein [Fictibacillus sp. NRS-1165]|uniref:MOSC N-terminal beta barrel domain-containing protein n=1 Tax=Fictibacillus sp. NRS-1165 TaxID=3144463 RepID=UPI003D1FAE95